MANGTAGSDRRRTDRVAAAVVDAAMKVHSALGPGLLESAYEACLAHELRRRGHAVRTQAPLAIEYDGVRVEVGYRLDLLVDDVVIVELKTVANVLPIHTAQLLSYLKLGACRVGLLMNFHALHLRDGITRMVHRF